MAMSVVLTVDSGIWLNYYAVAYYTMHQNCTVPEHTVAGEIV